VRGAGGVDRREVWAGRGSGSGVGYGCAGAAVAAGQDRWQRVRGSGGEAFGGR